MIPKCFITFAPYTELDGVALPDNEDDPFGFEDHDLLEDLSGKAANASEYDEMETGEEGSLICLAIGEENLYDPDNQGISADRKAGEETSLTSSGINNLARENENAPAINAGIADNGTDNQADIAADAINFSYEPDSGTAIPQQMQ